MPIKFDRFIGAFIRRQKDVTSLYAKCFGTKAFLVEAPLSTLWPCSSFARYDCLLPFKTILLLHSKLSMAVLANAGSFSKICF